MNKTLCICVKKSQVWSIFWLVSQNQTFGGQLVLFFNYFGDILIIGTNHVNSSPYIHLAKKYLLLRTHIVAAVFSPIVSRPKRKRKHPLPQNCSCRGNILTKQKCVQKSSLSTNFMPTMETGMPRGSWSVVSLTRKLR